MRKFKFESIAKILLIDSNKEDADSLTELISQNFEVVYAYDHVRALAILMNGQNTFSTIIVNLKNAIPLLQTIRKNPIFKSLPVIISSDSTNPELEDALLDLDIIYFLKKPYSKSQVISRIKNTIQLFEANKAIIELERDELTGLYTRQAFLHKAEEIRSCSPGRNFCIIAFDFDNFKSTNTLYGEKKCNEFLSYTAHALMEKVPYGISGRFGGDQYILFFTYREKVDIELLEKIRRSILDSAPIPHQIVKIGVYAPIDPETSMVLCCDRAFFAIRGIKGIYGKDIAFFESTLLQQLLDEQRIIETMEQGLHNGEFHVFYQPKHESVSGKIAGAEALVRWKHPEYGFLSPKQFIPLFERNGFISRLDCYILEQVCKDIKRWQTNGFPIVPVSVNISRHDFLEPGCLEHQYDIIEQYQIDHDYLHMEVTESLYSENTELIISKVKQTQNMGFLIEMDDFGSGYSSLGMLSRFPLDILKLDISFVQNIKDNHIVIENIIKMAHNMGLLTVAEGAESNEQFRTLRSLGCDFIQGYYFSKPLSTIDFEDYLNKSTIFTAEKSATPKSQISKTISLSESMLIAVNEVAESLPGGFFSCHADGDFEIIAFNTELVSIYDCESVEEFRKFTRNKFNSLIFEDDFDYVMKEIRNQISPDNDIANIEFRIKSKKGEIKEVRTFGRYIHAERYGNIFYVFVNDVTEDNKRKIEEEKEKLKQIELEASIGIEKASNQAKNLFMYNVANDILKPMKSIIKYTDEMQSNISNRELLEKNIIKAKHKEEHILSFINNIIELAQLENGEIKLSEVPTDITNATANIFNLIRDAAEQKNIKVEYSSEIIHPYIYQDILHTTDVVLNILMNALKYTSPGGTIKFKLIQYPGKNDNECTVDFICEDTGIGISKEFLPYVYENFSREDNEINKEFPSSGLGLNIAKKLLVLMHGTIEISSEKGKGTTVRTSQPHRMAKQSDVGKDNMLMANM